MASLVTDLYKELRRLSIAGGELGSGDFRLAKLLPLLKSAAEKAPVFGKLAAGAEKIVAPETPDRSRVILETAALARAVMCVQAKPEPVEGELAPLPETGLDTTIDQFSYRVVAPIKEALNTKGGGRRLVLEEGLKNGAASDPRLLGDLRKALDDGDSEIMMMAGQALARLGRPVAEGLLADFQPKGKRQAEVLRLEVLGRVLGPEGQAVYARAWAEGSAPVRRKALEFLAFSPENDALLLEALTADPETARAAALGIAQSGRPELIGSLAAVAADLLARTRAVDFRKSKKQADDQKEKRDKAEAAQVLLFLAFLSALGRAGSPRALELAREALKAETWSGLKLYDLAAKTGGGFEGMFGYDRGHTVHGLCLEAVIDFEAKDVLPEIRGRIAQGEADDGLVRVGANYCAKALGPAEFYELFRPLIKKGKTEAEKALIEVLTGLVDFVDLKRLADHRRAPSAQRPLDPRWGRVAAELELTSLAARMAAPGMPEVARILEKKLSEALKAPGLGHKRFYTVAYDLVRGLVQMGEQAFIKPFMKTLKDDYFLLILNYPEAGPDPQLLSVVPHTLQLMTLTPRDSFELLVELYKHPLKKEVIVSSFIDGFREQLTYALGQEAAASLDWAGRGIPLSGGIGQ